jgi:hypothetical protein
MNRPRESILELFDPLNCPLPSTPPSDSGSDKENVTTNHEAGPSGENLTMTAFFSRTYKSKPSQVRTVPPLTPRGRLVDISMLVDGDMSPGLPTEEEEKVESLHTSEKVSSSIGENLGRDDDDTITVKLPSAFPTPRNSSTPRTPLAEIPFEIKLSPLPRKEKLHKREVDPPANRATTTTQHPDNHPPPLSLSSIVNNVNAEGVPFAMARKFRPPKLRRKVVATCPQEIIPSEEYLSEDKAPVIVIAPVPEDEPRNDPVLHQTFSKAKFLCPRSKAVTSTPKAKHSSADLHVSFNLQSQFPEASFDLMNDKISFLTMEKSLLYQDDETRDRQPPAEEQVQHVAKVANRTGTLPSCYSPDPQALIQFQAELPHDAAPPVVLTISCEPKESRALSLIMIQFVALKIVDEFEATAGSRASPIDVCLVEQVPRRSIVDHPGVLLDSKHDPLQTRRSVWLTETLSPVLGDVGKPRPGAYIPVESNASF